MKLIELTRGKQAMVDDHWYDRLMDLGPWCFHGQYAQTRTVKEQGCKLLYMHHVICPRRSGLDVDHKDRNKLNNQEANLRLVTRTINTRNRGPFRTGYKGVRRRADSRRTGQQRWTARTVFDGKEVHLGVFQNEIEAAKAYDRAIFNHFGLAVFLNFPEDYAS